MQDRFGDVLVPTEEVIEMRAGQKRRSERKFFPGYVLVQIATHDEGGIPRIDNESWHLVKETPKVMGFIGGTADRPLPIRDAEADMILQRVQEASRSRSRRCCSSRARWSRGRRPVQRLQRRGRGRSTTTRAACAWRC
jgi:transcription antitermination factor NusG